VVPRNPVPRIHTTQLNGLDAEQFKKDKAALLEEERRHLQYKHREAADDRHVDDRFRIDLSGCFPPPPNQTWAEFEAQMAAAAAASKLAQAEPFGSDIVEAAGTAVKEPDRPATETRDPHAQGDTSLGETVGEVIGDTTSRTRLQYREFARLEQERAPGADPSAARSPQKLTQERESLKFYETRANILSRATGGVAAASTGARQGQTQGTATASLDTPPLHSQTRRMTRSTKAAADAFAAADAERAADELRSQAEAVVRSQTLRRDPAQTLGNQVHKP
jgi:hypothetical protein